MTLIEKSRDIAGYSVGDNVLFFVMKDSFVQKSDDLLVCLFG